MPGPGVPVLKGLRVVGVGLWYQACSEQSAFLELYTWGWELGERGANELFLVCLAVRTWDLLSLDHKGRQY